AYNAEHGITPRTIIKAIREGMESELKASRAVRDAVRQSEPEFEVAELTRMLEEEMLEAASQMEFEKAARLRDQVALLKSGKVKATGVTAGKGGATKVRRGDVDGAPRSSGGGAAPERKAGMPGVRANKKSKKGKNLGGKPF
ncbi:MAG TPA: UvrB/UvrC motif-containing protein, partial [Phycisphaerales bacterium]|nr:UvrB/UvrC motif-containing protein [Phycisphaerales bacterium]